MHEDDNDKDTVAATDVWWFMRALTDREKPEAWVEPVGESHLHAKPSTPFIGCRLCAGLGKWQTWCNKGMNKTIRKHLQSQHAKEYTEVMREQKLKGWQAMLKSASDASSASTPVGSKEPERFNHDDLQASIRRFQELVVRFFVVTDQPFSTSDSIELRDIFLYLNSDLKDEDIPHRTLIVKLIHERYKTSFTKLKDEMQSAEGRISFTSDLWSNSKLTSFMAITAHYITNDCRGNLVLRTRLVSFRAMPISHSGVNLAAAFVDVLKGLGIIHKIGQITLDNASNNDTMMREIQRLLIGMGTMFDSEQNRIRCFPHVINIAAKTGLKQLTKLPDEKTKDEDEEPEADEDDWLMPYDTHDCGITPESNTSLQADHAFKDALANDPVALVRNVVRVCRASGERREELRQVLTKGIAAGSFSTNITRVVTLLMDVVTRWSATYLMITRFLEIYEAVEMMFDPPHYRKLQDHLLSSTERAVLAEINEFLFTFHSAQELLSAEKTPTLALAAPVYENVYFTLVELRKHRPRISHGINAALRKLRKYMLRARKTRIYALAMIIHPLYKFLWMEEHWTADELSDAQQWMRDAMMTYRRQLPMPSTVRTVASVPRNRAARCQAVHMARLVGLARKLSSSTVLQSSLSPASRSSSPIPPTDLPSTPTEAEQTQSQDEEHQRLVSAELDRYIKEGLEFEDLDPESKEYTDAVAELDLCRFWQSKRTQFPILYRVALDILPVQASAVPCERVFSSSRETFTSLRTNMSHENMEILQILKFLYRQERTQDEGLDFSHGIVVTEDELSHLESSGLT